MKQLFFLLITGCLIAFASVDIQAQGDSKWADIDKSPLDMAYYPANVAWRNYLTGEDRNKRPQMRIVYSRPSMKGREIFGNLVPFGAEWRLGANEATELTLYNAVNIDGTTVPRGTYTMSATPAKDHWMIHLSTQGNIWGSEKRDQEQTIASVKVMTEALDDSNENLSMTFQRIDDEMAFLVIEWDKTRVRMPIGMNPVQFEDMDVSPMDRVHYPKSSAYQNYLAGDELANSDPKIKVTYGRPQKKGRKVFGEMLEYGKLWRVGANESTEVTFFSDVTINGEKLRGGSYNLYAMVNQDTWEFIFNTDRPSWGHANRDESKDVLKYTSKVEMDSEDLEVLNIIFEEQSDNEVHLVVAWEKTRARIPIKF